MTDTEQCLLTLLRRAQKRILLTLGETVNLINKQYRRSRIKESTTFFYYYLLFSWAMV